MRYLILVVSLVCGCLSEALAADTSAELNTQLGMLLRDVAARATSNPVVFKEGHLSIGKRVVDIAAVSENSVTRDAYFLEAARFLVRVDGVSKPNLTGGVVGVATSKGSAIETAVKDWHLYFGQALIRALSRAPSRLTAGRWSVYEGAMGLRGSVPTGSWVDDSDAMHKRILGCISASLAALAPGEEHAVVLTLNSQKSAGIDG